MTSLNVRFIHFLHVYNRSFVVVGYKINAICTFIYQQSICPRAHKWKRNFYFFRKGGGGAGIKVCLSVILLNYEFIYIHDPLMGGDTHRVCDF